MAEYIKTLKEDNGDITYPVTQAGAVLLTGGGDLETTLNGKASQTSVNGKISIGDVQYTDLVANSVRTAAIQDLNVTTGKIANGAVTGVTNTATSVGSTKLALATVGTPNLRDSAVTTAKLAAGIVTMTRTELYSSSAGATGNIIVSQALNNFDEVEFWIIDPNSTPNQLIRTIPGDALAIVLDIPHPGGTNTVYWNLARWSWTAGATTLTQSSNHYQKVISTSVSNQTANYIKIRKIVGIKFVSHT